MREAWVPYVPSEANQNKSEQILCVKKNGAVEKKGKTKELLGNDSEQAFLELSKAEVA